MNVVKVKVECEDGCTIENEEYSLNIYQFLGSLDINSVGGIDDISLIKECCDDYLLSKDEYISRKEAFVVDMTLSEVEEYEDVFINKYYQVSESIFEITVE